MDFNAVESGPQAIFNFTWDDRCADWEAVVVKFLPPACIPEPFHGGLDGRKITGLLEVTGYAGLLENAVKMGTFLKAKFLTDIAKILKLPLPGKKQGSGSTGGLVKLDYARALVHYFFPEASANDFEWMVNGTWTETQGAPFWTHRARIITIFSKSGSALFRTYSRIGVVQGFRVVQKYFQVYWGGTTSSKVWAVFLVELGRNPFFKF